MPGNYFITVFSRVLLPKVYSGQYSQAARLYYVNPELLIAHSYYHYFDSRIMLIQLDLAKRSASYYTIYEFRSTWDNAKGYLYEDGEYLLIQFANQRQVIYERRGHRDNNLYLTVMRARLEPIIGAKAYEQQLELVFEGPTRSVSSYQHYDRVLT